MVVCVWRTFLSALLLKHRRPKILVKGSTLLYAMAWILFVGFLRYFVSSNSLSILRCLPAMSDNTRKYLHLGLSDIYSSSSRRISISPVIHLSIGRQRSSGGCGWQPPCGGYGGWQLSCGGYGGNGSHPWWWECSHGSHCIWLWVLVLPDTPSSLSTLRRLFLFLRLLP